jgi:hypothetical protein
VRSRSLDEKLAAVREGRYTPADFVIADAKDADMGFGLTAPGPARTVSGPVNDRVRSRAEYLEAMRAIVRDELVDVMLMSASSAETLVAEGLFADSAVTPAVRLNDTTDIWFMRGSRYREAPSRPFRTAAVDRVARFCDLGLYSITFNNDLDADLRSLEAFAAFRADALANGFSYFLEVFNPNVDTGLAPDVLPHFVNDSILRCLAGLTKAERPRFLKIAYNGPKALEELASFDPDLVVGVLGGGAGTTRDTFELLHQAERYGARVALFGRKINLAESPLAIVALMRQVADGAVGPAEAVKAYHDELRRQGIRPARELEDDNRVTEPALRQG